VLIKIGLNAHTAPGYANVTPAYFGITQKGMVISTVNPVKFSLQRYGFICAIHYYKIAIFLSDCSHNMDCTSALILVYKSVAVQKMLRQTFEAKY
jgi:hypothetical protein